MVLRSVLLAASTNAWLRERAMKTAFVRHAVSAFMPGERLEDAMAAAKAEHEAGIGTILTKLGENVENAGEADEVTAHYLESLDRIHAGGLRACISVKPTQLGLDLDAARCLANLRRLVERAAERDNFVWIDMESSTYVDRTLDLFRRMRVLSPRVGVALQAYLRRTEADVEALLRDRDRAPSIRLVKGAYLEPASIAFARKADVDDNYFRLASRLLGAARPAGTFLQIATHDERLVNRLAPVIDSQRLTAADYEHAMLYGIQRPLQRRIAGAGRPLRVLISYGDYWFPWYMRRLAERPANLWFVLKSAAARW
jgi:proline dehydrogenase